MGIDITSKYAYAGHAKSPLLHKRKGVVVVTHDPRDIAYGTAEGLYTGKQRHIQLGDRKLSVNDHFPYTIVRGDKVTQIFVPKETGALPIEVSLHKGGFMASKRLSRIMRPVPIFGWRDNLHIEYTPDKKRSNKIWDGAGVVSRKFLLSLIPDLALEDKYKKRYVRELREGKRFEFTIQTNKGQYKGHCIVDERPEAPDFLIPDDLKTEVRLTCEETLVTLMPYHNHDGMALDIQSRINLNGLFSNDYLFEQLEKEADQVIDEIASGDKEAMFKRWAELQEGTSSDWWLAEFLQSGGETVWFPKATQALGNDWRKRVLDTYAGKVRAPIAGGRYYILTAGVAKAAGHKIPNLRKGEVYIDDVAIWVTNSDWIAFIALVAGGADHDDGFWVHPFTDTDGERKVICWRSPNQVGEYVIMTLANEDYFGEYRPADSSLIATRIDKANQKYVWEESDFDLNYDMWQGKEYNTANMLKAITEPILGRYVNVLMVLESLGMTKDTELAVPLEVVIDNEVKFGGDLSHIADWIDAKESHFIQHGIRIPRFLGGRMAVEVDEDGVHEIDTMIAGFLSILEGFDKRLAEVSAIACPPREVWDYPLTREVAQVAEAFVQNYKHQLDDFVEFEYEACQLHKEYGYELGIALMRRIYLFGNNDGVLFLKGMWGMVHDALSQLGVYESWTPAKLFQVNGVWFNEAIRKEGREFAQMSDVPKDMRSQYKDSAKTKQYIGTVYTIKYDADEMRHKMLEGSEVVGYLKPLPTLTERTFNTTPIKAYVRDGNVRMVCE
jgi:hypothetical protein